MNSSLEKPEVNTVRRRSIFKNEEVPQSDNLEEYPATYRNSLELELQHWIEEICSLREEYETVSSEARTEREVAVDRSIFSKEELAFFDQSLYYKYFDQVRHFSDKLTAVIEQKRNNDIMEDCKKKQVQRMMKDLDEEIKTHLLTRHNQQSL